MAFIGGGGELCQRSAARLQWQGDGGAAACGRGRAMVVHQRRGGKAGEQGCIGVGEDEHGKGAWLGELARGVGAAAPAGAWCLMRAAEEGLCVRAACLRRSTGETMELAWWLREKEGLGCNQWIDRGILIRWRLVIRWGSDDKGI